MAVVAIYSRKSKFTDKGESIQNQIELCKHYANDHFHVNNFLLYEDEGYSGGNVERPMFKKMIKDIKSKSFNVLICYRLDRISRNISDFSNLVELLQDNNIDFVSLREQFDTSTPMGRAMMYITSVFAQLERETIAERIKDNMYQLARTGRWLGGKTPMGFESKPIQYMDKDKGTRKMYILSPIETELDLVKQIFSKYLELSSLSQLESWIQENNLKTKNDKSFDKSTLRVILTNPVYAIANNLLYEYFQNNNSDIASSKEEFDNIHGLMVFNKHDEKKNKVVKKDESHWIVAVGKHKGVIPSKEWIKVQKLLVKNRKKAPRSGTGEVGLVTQLLRCKHCGSKMRVITYRRKSGIYHYYKCLLKERSRGTKCNAKNLNGKIADQSVIDEVKKINCKKDNIYKYLKEIRDNLSGTLTMDDSRKTNIHSQIHHLEESINNLTANLSENKDSIASKYIIKQIEEYDLKINDLKKRLIAVNSEKRTYELNKININSILEIINNFSNNVDKLDFNEKRYLISRIFDEILWDGNKLEISVLFS